MAGWIDQLMAAGGYGIPNPNVPVPPVPYVEGSEFVDPDIDPRTGKKKVQTPFPEIKAPVQQWGPMAGILEPGIGQMNGAGLEPGRAYMPDPMMPGNSPSPFMQPAERKMQSLTAPFGLVPNADPDLNDETLRGYGSNTKAGGVPTPTARPSEADAGNVAAAGASGARPLASASPPMIREADGSKLPATDISSSNRGQEGNGQPQEQSGFGSLMPRIGDFLKNNSNTLLALGAGFAGAPNIGQGISRASAAAIPAARADISQRTLLQTQSSTYRALVDAGVPRQQALAAVGNPKLAEALIQSYITDRKNEIKEIKEKDAFGNERTRLVAVNPYDRTSQEITPTGGARGASAGDGAGIGSAPTTFAKGVTMDTFNHSAVGEDYLKQFSPEVQADVKSYLSGRSMPTGRQGAAQIVKQIAKKYGDDIGMPADDALVTQRKVFSNSLGDTKSGVGMQAKGAQQGLEHFVKLSDTMVKLKLSNGLGIEPVANFANWFKSLSTEQQDMIHNANVKGQALAGEMGKLFSGTTGGGVHERAETKKNISNAFQSTKAAAGSLEGVLEMMEGGINSLTQRRDQLFPDKSAWPKGSDFMTEKQLAEMAQIRHNIAILRGEEKPDGGAAPARGTAAPAPGRYRYDPATGSMAPVQ